jgi:hypothetical protein
MYCQPIGIQTAYLVWVKLLETERLLRGLYNDEFLELIRKDPSLLPPGVDIDDFIPF